MLDNRSAIVTGSSLKLGIGYSIADALAAQGCNVMLSGRRSIAVSYTHLTLPTILRV